MRTDIKGDGECFWRCLNRFGIDDSILCQINGYNNWVEINDVEKNVIAISKLTKKTYHLKVYDLLYADNVKNGCEIKDIFIDKIIYGTDESPAVDLTLGLIHIDGQKLGHFIPPKGI